MTIEEALLLFDKWWTERTRITCTFLGGGLRLRITGTIDRIEPDSILMYSADESARLHLPLHSMHLCRYCDPRELNLPEAEEQFAGFLVIRLPDGGVLQFAEPK
jgi:hypothetical protein